MFTNTHTEFLLKNIFVLSFLTKINLTWERVQQEEVNHLDPLQLVRVMK